MIYKRLKINEQEGIVHVWLNRPEKLNAFDLQMFKELDHFSKRIKNRLDVRVIIIQGQGKAFSSGLDIKNISSSKKAMVKLLWKWFFRRPNLAQRVTANWQKIPVPVFAVIQGQCFGAGMQLALGADFRIASSDATFSIMESKWGLFPDMAGFLNLRTVVSKDQAMWLTMSGEIITASKAKELGLVTMVCDKPFDIAFEMATKLGKISPDSLAATKYTMSKFWNSPDSLILKHETKYQTKILLGKNFKIASRNQLKTLTTPYVNRKIK